MQLKCFSVFDDKAKAYLPPFFLPEVGMALRTFGDCVCDGTHQFGKHPGDYSLFLIGVFDSNSGVLSVSPTLELLGNGLEVRARVAGHGQSDLPLKNGGANPRDHVGVHVK